MVDLSEFSFPISDRLVLSQEIEKDRIHYQRSLSINQQVALQMYTYHYDNAINSNLRKCETSFFHFKYHSQHTNCIR